ncbi:NUDIX hydrolase [Candidatus Poribacteria bacterium]|nr:NUDIX hydrolase [Candidatus Poribacteria bacterium]
MAHVNRRLTEMEALFGSPAVHRQQWLASDHEMALLYTASSRGRLHDVTLLIARGEQFAVIRKPSYPAHVYRPPSGGVEIGETLSQGAAREAYEETGTRISLRRYLVRAEMTFVRDGHPSETLDWMTHVFLADWLEGSPAPVDTQEIADARWATRDELSAGLLEELEAAETHGLRYRGWLQRIALDALSAWDQQPVTRIALATRALRQDPDV